MNEELLKNICFETLCTKLPVELIDEIIHFIPKCNYCKIYPTTSTNTCNNCNNLYCNMCVRKCNDCDKDICYNELCCNEIYYKHFSKCIYICNSCFSNPKCNVCKQLDYHITESCIECLKIACHDCSYQCCSDDIICDNCVDDSDKMYKCICDNKIMCNECSYRCRYCGHRICGECKDISVAYYNKILCLECNNDI